MSKLKLENLKFELSEKDFKFGMTVDASADYQTNADEYFAKAMIGENSFRSKIRVLPNVKDRTKLGTVTFNSVLKAGDCDFDPSNSAIKQKTFEVCPLMVGTEICVESLEASFIADQLASGSNNYSDRNAFMDFFYKTLSETVAEQLEELTFRGDSENAAYSGTTEYLGTCDGLEKLLSDNEDVLKPTSATTVTPANVIDKMIEARNALPTAVKKKSDFIYIVSTDVAEAYQDAVASGSPLAYYNGGLEDLKFQGKAIVIAEGASDGTIIAGQLSNFSFATDLMSDENAWVVVDFLKTILKRKIGVRTDFKFGVDVIVAGEVYAHIV